MIALLFSIVKKKRITFDYVSHNFKLYFVIINFLYGLASFFPFYMISFPLFILMFRIK